jgi:type IV secretion system protein VirB10
VSSPTHHSDADTDGIDNAGIPKQDANPYSAQYVRDTAIPDLDVNAPQLRSADVRRMNRRAMLFLAGIVVLVVFVAAWMMNTASHRNDEASKPRTETVSIPDAPKGPPTLPPPEVPNRRANPIALSSIPPLPDVRQMPPPVTPEEPRGPSLMERRMEQGNGTGQAAAPAPAAAGATIGLQASDTATSAQPLNHPDAVMLRGTYIRCVLETRIITDIPGFTSCIVTEPVYSFNGKRLLLPKGSKVLGKYDTVPATARVAVIWDRIVTPTGIDVNMASPGVDGLGGAGHPGYLDSHWGSRIGAALLISMLSDAFKYEGAKHGPSTTALGNGFAVQSPYESNTARTLQSLSQQAVQQSANRPPTVTINQGAIVNIYVAKDVDFSGVVARL